MKFWLQLSLIFCALSVGILALRLADAVSSVSESAVRNLAQVTKDADDLKQMTSATLFQVGDASHEVAEMAREQKGYWQQSAEQTTAALRKTNLVLDQLTDSIQHVDQSQAAIAASADHALQAIPAVLLQTQSAVAETQSAVSRASAAIDNMNRVIQDPNIPATLAHVQQTAIHIDSVSSSLDVAVKRWTKPKALWKSLLVGGLDSASKVAILAK